MLSPHVGIFFHADDRSVFLARILFAVLSRDWHVGNAGVVRAVAVVLLAPTVGSSPRREPENDRLKNRIAIQLNATGLGIGAAAGCGPNAGASDILLNCN